MKKNILLLCMLAFAATAVAQDTHVQDSLYAILKNAENDSVKKEVFGALYNYYYPINRDSANNYGTKIIELAKATNDTRLLYEVYGFLGSQSRTAGNYLSALEWNNKMLELAQEKNDSSKAATAFNEIGNLYKDQKLYNKAVVHYMDCKKLSEGYSDTNYLYNLLYANMNLGYVYEQMKKIDSALIYEQTAYTIALNLNDKESLGYVLYCLGNIQLKLNNKTLALEYYKMGITTLPKENRYSCLLYIALSKFYKGTNNDTAINYAGKALTVATRISNVKCLAESSKMLSEVFAAKNNKDSAYYYQDMYIMLHDSLYNRERIAQFENLNFNEILHQQEKKEALQQAIERRIYNIQLVILTLVILFVLMLFLLISRSIIVSHKLVAFLSIVVLLVLFEFINLLMHPILENVTHDKPVPMLLVMVAIAGLLVPLHHRLEKWTTNKLVEKNKAIRLANAKKVIEELEKAGTG